MNHLCKTKIQNALSSLQLYYVLYVFLINIEKINLLPLQCKFNKLDFEIGITIKLFLFDIYFQRNLLK